MANTKISQLTTFSGNTTGSFLLMNDSTNTTTYKVTRETLFTGSLNGTSSYASNAASASFWSGSITNALSSSFATTASFWSGSIINAATASFVQTAQTASFVTTAQTASFVTTAQTASFYNTSNLATTGSNNFNGNQSITGSLTVSSVAVISSSISANNSSLTLNSGSNFFLQNGGIAQISGSFTQSGSLVSIGPSTFTGSFIVTGSSTLTGSLNIMSGSITMPNRPAFRVTGAGGAKVAVTPLTGSYLNVDYQQGGGWDTATGTFTAPIAGLYQVNVVVRTNSNSLGTISQLIVYKNNTGGTTGTPQVMIEFGSNTTMNHAGGSTISYLAAGDTLKMVVANGEISFDTNDNFSVAYIG